MLKQYLTKYQFFLLIIIPLIGVRIGQPVLVRRSVELMVLNPLQMLLVIPPIFVLL